MIMTDQEIIEQLRAENQQLTKERNAALMKLGFTEDELQVIGMRHGPNGQGVVVEVAHQALQDFAIAMCDSFINGGATNYFVVGVQDPRNGDEYAISMQKRTGKTPIELHQLAKARIQELEERIIDLENGTNDKQ